MDKVAFEVPAVLCLCRPLPCLLYRIRTPFLWGRLGRQGGPE